MWHPVFVIHMPQNVYTDSPKVEHMCRERVSRETFLPYQSRAHFSPALLSLMNLQNNCDSCQSQLRATVANAALLSPNVLIYAKWHLLVSLHCSKQHKHYSALIYQLGNLFPIK